MGDCKPLLKPDLNVVMQEKSIKGEDEPNRMSHWRFGSWVLVVLATVVVILLFTTTCLVVTVNMIWNDVNELKTELAELKQECGDGLTKPEPKETAKVKRQLDTQTDDYSRLALYGIPFYDIALIRGDPLTLDEPIYDRRKKFKNTTTSIEACSSRYMKMKNGYNDLLCKRKMPVSDQVTKMKFTQRSEDLAIYPYFTKADWMNEETAEEKYRLHRSGKISVRSGGIYIVHGSIHFSVNEVSTFPYYSIYMSDSEGYNERLITKCVITTMNGNTNEDIFPCQAWQMVQLEAGDLIYMTISNHVWFRIEKETFHLALLKLNDGLN